MEAWNSVRNRLETDPDNWETWEQCIAAAEQVVAADPAAAKEDPLVQKHIHYDFDTMLAKWPHLTQFWQRYVTVEYTLNGLEAAKKVLERATGPECFWQSLDLWLDYLNIVIANKLADDESTVRDLFKAAVRNTGRQFLSHPLWDLYIGWEEGVSGKNSQAYLDIFLELIRLPLHQYSRYGEAFSELRKNFAITDLIKDPSDVKEVLASLDIDSNDLSALDDETADKVSDVYFNRIFKATQQGVAERWPFESKIEKPEFDTEPVADAEQENWIAYLDFQEAQNQDDQTISLYERCLIPLCSYPVYWQRYFTYLASIGNEAKLQQIYAVVDSYLSTENTEQIRYTYASWLELQGDTEKAQGLLLDTCKQCPYSYEAVGRLFHHFYNHMDHEVAIKDALATVDAVVSDEHLDASPEFEKLLPLLNKRTVSQLIVDVANIHWHDVKYTRELLIRYFKQEFVRSSAPYWNTFVRFELAQHNKKNLTNIINYIKYNAEFAAGDVNNLIATYLDFMFKNCSGQELAKLAPELIRYQLEISPESSTSMKHFLKTRLDPDHKEEETNRRLIRENGHPSATAEAWPRTSNPIDFNLPLDSGTMPLPRVSGTEKANAPVKFLTPNL